MTDSFDPQRHVLAVRASFQTPVPDSGWTGVLQVAGQPGMTTHAQVLDANQDVFNFLSPYQNNLHVRERIEHNHGQLVFGYLPHPPPHNSLGNFLRMPEQK